jgi:hypothetical protein
MILPIDVELAPYEVAAAWDVTGRRWWSSQQRGGQDVASAAGTDMETRFWRSLNGTAGEIAAAKALRRYWPPSVDTFHAADIPPDIQVRTRTGPFDELCVRQNDMESHRYVLVIGNVPTFRLIGWMYGYQAKEPEWRGTSGKTAVWYVPTIELRDLRTLT